MSEHELDQIFGPEGALSRVLSPHYEYRPQQDAMAQASYRVLSRGGRVLVEAPTGVGKSLGYLIPGVLWAMETRQPLVVSTYTRGLQDQIMEKDLPHLRRLVEREIRAVVLKGRTNYLCRNRWRLFLEETRGTVEGEELERALSHWVEYTESGDLSEAPLPSGKNAGRILALFPRICSESRACSTVLCTPDAGCFFKRSRARAREAHLVVVNHSLLLIDLFTEAAGLPEWSAAVIDEAHHLPRIAAEPLSFSVNEAGLESALKGLGGRGEPGLTEQLRHFLRGHPSKVERTQMLSALRELEEETGRLLLQARSFWADFGVSKGFPAPGLRLRYGPTSPVRNVFPASGLDLCNRLSLHLDHLGEKIEEARRARRNVQEIDALSLLEAERHGETARGSLHALEELLTPSRKEFIYWIEPGTPSGTALKASPLEVGPQLQTRLFQRKEAVILTSATLAVQGDFSHMAGKLGLGPDSYEGICLPTPFRLGEQVAAFVLPEIPPPNAPEFVDSLARGIEMMARTLRRKMLVLFTAHDTLRQVEAKVRRPLEERGVRLLAQGLDGGQRQVRSGFQETGPAVLLGAASFWEGVDFPGEELEILVMARLPFLVPTDPLVEAMSEKLQVEGQNPFQVFQLPEAIIRFRQGFGRLIRRGGDRGLFVLVDPRLETRSYGAAFRKSIGIDFRRAEGWEDLIRQGSAWFNQDS